MRATTVIALCLSIAALLTPSLVRAGPPAPALERGRYVVEQIAMCGECHTPRSADGALDRTRWLQGAPVPVQAPPFVRAWAIEAPRIAGLGAYSDEQAIRLLTEGIARNGQPLRAPMPGYRFNSDDAAAVLAYLRSLR